MRTLELSHEEIELIQKALNKVYSDNLELIRNNTLDAPSRMAIAECANEFAELQSDIQNGRKDV